MMYIKENKDGSVAITKIPKDVEVDTPNTFGTPVTEEELPPNRALRDAWVMIDGKVHIDVNKAKNVLKIEKELELAKQEEIVQMFPSLQEEFQTTKSKLLAQVDSMSLEEIATEVAAYKQKGDK